MKIVLSLIIVLSFFPLISFGDSKTVKGQFHNHSKELSDTEYQKLFDKTFDSFTDKKLAKEYIAEHCLYKNTHGKNELGARCRAALHYKNNNGHKVVELAPRGGMNALPGFK